MILTCPECATSYHVDDGRIPSGGRTVRCSSCGARWHTAEAPAAQEAVAPPPPEPEVEPPAEEPAPQPAAAAPVDPADDLEITGPELRQRRRTPPPEPRKKSAVGAVVAWTALAATLALVAVAGIVFRGEVVKLLPQSSRAYAAVGLPVNSLGLVFEQVKADTVFQGGRPVLSVTGAIHNVADHAADAPPLRIDLLNKAGKPVAAKVARPIDPRIPAGAKRHFAITIVDPPSTAHDLQVAFEAPAKGAVPHAAEAVLAPAPAEAQPLPPGSPDALPDHHG
jgi:predicted Zn finger-like uncharacterized protein